MTRIAVFGASGQTGLHLVAQALAKNHVVKAIVRNEAKLRTALLENHDIKENDNLQVVQVDNIFDDKQLAEPLKDVDVVLSTLGFARGST